MKKTLSRLVETAKRNKRHCFVATLLTLALLLSLAVGCSNDEPKEVAPGTETLSTTTAYTTGEGTTAPSDESGVTTTVGDTVTTTVASGTTTTTVSTATKQKETKASTSTTTKKATTTKSTTTTTQQKVVQAADPDTGISWDGKSDIVYMYEDGSTGTEAKPGAKYEYRPGVVRVVPPDLSDAPENTGYCPHCGKKEGDGANGTCLRYIGSKGHDCGNCGVYVEAKTCHSCEK